ncbi:MAG TPA: HrpB1 family type III secretion system apparatus protein [Albitalea sp.]|uniref:HrpB1 family type III secretion system apparatus protein n=1 Tax=Piscinibacter sp. TaxID=1903157 RepID=UPI002ED3ED1B
MDPKLMSKEVFRATTDALTLGLTHDRIDDAESALVCLRAMRPRISELDTFEAWILMKRGFFKDAARLLATVESSPHAGLQAKALLTYCQFATGDERWSHNATEVIESGGDPDASQLMRMLMDPEGAVRAIEERDGEAQLIDSAQTAAVVQGKYMMRA